MTRAKPTGVVVLSALLLQASAQLLSCSDINCPMSFGFARCDIENISLTQIGVANFSSDLSPNPLTWTIGYAPKAFTNSTDQRRYYLGTPRGLNLNTRTDITGCALFFTGVEAGLTFIEPNGTALDLGAISGTCADALGITCTSDLISQAQDLAADSSNLQCSDIAQTLQSSPPVSCIKAGTWGNITAKTITGSDSPSTLQLNDCNPTTNKTYDLQSVATFPRLGDEPFVNNITPLMTIFAATGNATDVMASPEVHLNCMKLMEDSPPNEVVSEGSGCALTVRKSLPSMFAAMFGFLAVTAFMV